MLIFFFALALTATSIYIYKRYVPVWGVPCLKAIEQTKSDSKILDVRDYNYVLDTLPKANNIPVAYLQRNYRELIGESVIVVASSHMEKNISVRFLMKKGINVVGYEIIGTPCKCTKLKII